MEAVSANGERYDVVIIGGALAGSACATLLLREQPRLKILILEKSTCFGRRVGEATVEVSCYFLCRILGLTQYLNESQLVKQGMRFWFQNSQTHSLPDCSEVGGRYLARIPSFQVDRSSLDEEVLRRAVKLGATAWRPANVTRVQLVPGGEQIVQVRHEEQAKEVRARWVVDASGFAALLARQEGWWQPNKAHPTTAVWARWTGVKDWDGLELAKKYPDWAKECHGIRGTATNHLVGLGWWAWVIPLKGGDVSIGLVFDQRLVTWPEGGSLGQRLKDFLSLHPVGRELLADAQWIEGDVHWRKNLPYYSSRMAGDGFLLIGDAAGFIDPFYSPGMDWVSFTSSSAVGVILAQQKGENAVPLVAKYNQDFGQSYQRWFQALYENKYEYMGDYDLMQLAFRIDLGLYYLGVVSQPFMRGMVSFTEPMFSTKLSTPFYYFIRFYNRRFVQLARQRRRENRWGRHNHARRRLIRGYTLARTESFQIAKALFGWLILELTEGWKTWLCRLPCPSAESNTPREFPVQPMASPKPST